MRGSESPRSLLERGLAAAGSLCFIAVLLTVAVHLIESIWPALLAILGAIAVVGGAGMLGRYWWGNRYR